MERCIAASHKTIRRSSAKMIRPTTMAGADALGPEDDRIDRRGFLDCMRWAGAGLIWTLQGGIPTSSLLGAPRPRSAATGDFSFVQISDSHIGFSKAANPDVNGTLQATVSRILASSPAPE